MCDEGIPTVEDLPGFFVDLATGVKDFGVYRVIVERFQNGEGREDD